jgi:hypothetical protein
MAEVYTNPFTVTLTANYTAGDTTLSVSGAAPVAIQTGTFRVRLANSSNTVLKVTAGASTTTWTVVAEFNDANAVSGATVYGCEVTPAMLTALLPVATPPYLSINGRKYVAVTMFPATAPDLTSFSYIQGTTTNTTGANGSVLVRNTSTTTPVWYGTTAAASIEAVYCCGSGLVGTPTVAYYEQGVWLWDSTNGFIYAMRTYNIAYEGNQAAGAGNTITNNQIIFSKIAYSGSGSLGSRTNVAYGGAIVSPVQHLKIFVSAGVLTAGFSQDGGQTFHTLPTQSVGTISKAGICLEGSGDGSEMTLLSLEIN